jgi:Domain of unknown function (DUF4384)
MSRSPVLSRTPAAESRLRRRSKRAFRAVLLLLAAATGALPASALGPSVAPRPVPATAGALTYWIELLEAPVGPGPQVDEHRIFRSGEKIRLHVRSRREGFVSLVQLHPSGPANVLFPRSTKSLADNRVRANEDRVLPTESYWFSFDEKPGNEDLFLVFCATQEALESILDLARRPGTRDLPGALRIQLKHQ